MEKVLALQKRLAEIKQMLKIDALRLEKQALAMQMSAPDFWSDKESAVSISQRMEVINSSLSKYDKLAQELVEISDILKLSTADDTSLLTDIDQQLIVLEKLIAELEFSLLFSGAHDQSNAIFSIYAGTGGVDAQDFAEILERMYLRFCEQKGFKVEILDISMGNEAGIKSVVMRVVGPYAYGYLKSEHGVHRLGRISPFDAEALRQTSFAGVEVIPEIIDSSNDVIKAEDLKIDCYQSSGPGGQNVNKTASAVRITHLPSGIVVACQSQRSQHQNKENALSLLRAKLLLLKESEKDEELKQLKGEVKTAQWSNQIRSYILYGTRLVKDHRTGYETGDIEGVFDGKLDSFIEAYLRSLSHI